MGAWLFLRVVFARVARQAKVRSPRGAGREEQSPRTAVLRLVNIWLLRVTGKLAMLSACDEKLAPAAPRA